MWEWGDYNVEYQESEKKEETIEGEKEDNRNWGKYNKGGSG